MAVDCGATARCRPWLGVVVAGGVGGALPAVADEGDCGFDFDREDIVAVVVTGGKGTGAGGGVRNFVGDAFFTRLVEYVEYDVAGAGRIADDT